MDELSSTESIFYIYEKRRRKKKEKKEQKMFVCFRYFFKAKKKKKKKKLTKNQQQQQQTTLTIKRNRKKTTTKTQTLYFPRVSVACSTCYLCWFSNVEANEMTVWSEGWDMSNSVLILPGYHA